jgi:hypothetical protein
LQQAASNVIHFLLGQQAREGLNVILQGERKPKFGFVLLKPRMRFHVEVNAMSA